MCKEGPEQLLTAGLTVSTGFLIGQSKGRDVICGPMTQSKLYFIKVNLAVAEKMDCSADNAGGG